ncbi:MAG: uracil-DNA glycosylase, partial [Planctomycetes bacterium]|nr:uracil-DNA glycosylase [Planctomycetota bacterium]
MAIDPAHLRQHLQWAAGAYGLDLVLPAGRTEPRAARPAPPLVPASEEVLTAEAPPSAPPRAVAPAPAPAPAIAAVPAATPPPRTEPPPPATDDLAAATEALRQLRAEVMPCTRCMLHEQRQLVVFGEGNPRARVMFIGEAPGATEDQTGRPFVGP